ncbi:hypothetical protein INT48_002699 [Thamnidium elegans]|uniref:GDP/GTP exchange factor Sec2 N-terminal domain-containing protein n=1 Tax=Thamnidium elegans TaxID=101142 RepID=A0A8H7VWC2_9FUNG|nr:hypothetical protein INT48_002699 [Thamnidium elegans]
MSIEIKDCDCFKIINTSNPHQCNLCKRTFSACLYANELQHKISLQAAEIDQLKNDLTLYEQELRRQKLDFETLNRKYLAGIDRVTEFQKQRELANCELEELSARLFEEANNMVACEKREKRQLEVLLRTTEDQLIMEQSQLYELRARIESTTALSSPPPPPYFDNVKKPMAQTMRIYNDHKTNISLQSETSTQLLFNQLKAQQEMLLAKHNDMNNMDETQFQMVSPINKIRVINDHNTPTTTATTTTTTTTTNKDADDLFVNHGGVLQLDYFQKFIQQQKRRNSSVPSLISDNSIEEEEEYSIFQLYPHTPPSEYMTRCEIEDIEPCLQFGNSNSRMHVKVMMSHMSQTPCFIESITLDEAKKLPPLCNATTSVYYRPIWERLTSASPQQKHQLECSACGKKRRTNIMASYYRFRLDENEDWLLIDQNCRDRLVAVCNFYSFIKHIQMGYYDRQLLNDLYLENVNLRLKMFYSR